MIAQFSLRLICGMSLMWMLMPRSQVTTGFFRIQMLVALGLSVLTALTMDGTTVDPQTSESLLSHTSVVSWCGLLAVGAFLGSVIWTLQNRGAGAFFVFFMAIASIGLLMVLTLDSLDAGGALLALYLLSELSTASLLGASVTGMLLGHWYLTAPTMSIAPLSRLNFYFGVSVLFRLLISSAALWLARGEISNGTIGLWLSLRWIAGIFGPLVVVMMVWRILKYRNTQSATGVLFVGVIFTFIGEMTATLLFQELQIPV